MLSIFFANYFYFYQPLFCALCPFCWLAFPDSHFLYLPTDEAKGRAKIKHLVEKHFVDIGTAIVVSIEFELECQTQQFHDVYL